MGMLVTFLWKCVRATGRTPSERTDGEQGSTLVETALSIVVLLTFIFGVMEMGLAL